MELKVHFPLNDHIAQLPKVLDSLQTASQFLNQLLKIPNRSISFFDEIISGYIILKNNDYDHRGENNNSYGRLVESLTRISIELSIQPSEYLKGSKDRVQLSLLHVPNGSNLIYNNLVDNVYTTIWGFEIPVTYPKKKILQPKIIINVLVNVHHQCFEELVSSDVEVSSQLQKSRNLLQGIESRTFKEDENLADPFLPEALVNPIDNNNGSALSSKGNNSDSSITPMILKAKFSLPVYPILTMRLKSAKIAGQTHTNSVLLTLDLSSSKDVFKIDKLAVLVTKIELTLKDGEVVELFDKDLKNNLIFLNKKDNINLTFKLSLRSNFDNDLIKPLNIKIVTIPKIADDVNLTSKIEMKWITNIDFESTASAALKKKQILSRSVSSQNLAGSQRRSYLSLSQLPQQSSVTNLTGLKFTLFGINKVKLGDIFQWNLQIFNSSNKVQKLLILLNNDSFLNDSILEKKFPKLPIHYNSKTKSRSTVSLNSLSKDPTSMIQPQLNLIRGYNSNRLKTCGIVCLSNELRVDSLDPQSIVHLKFDIMSIQKGIYNLEGVKIVDLNSGESYECGKLLQVVVD